jgi:hypothetical protein
METVRSPSIDLHKIKTVLGDQEDTSWEFVHIQIYLKPEPPKIMIVLRTPLLVRSQRSCVNHSTNVDVQWCTENSNWNC